jgi:hypothetical protein
MREEGLSVHYIIRAVKLSIIMREEGLSVHYIIREVKLSIIMREEGLSVHSYKRSEVVNHHERRRVVSAFL